MSHAYSYLGRGDSGVAVAPQPGAYTNVSATSPAVGCAATAATPPVAPSPSEWARVMMTYEPCTVTTPSGNWDKANAIKLASQWCADFLELLTLAAAPAAQTALLPYSPRAKLATLMSAAHDFGTTGDVTLPMDDEGNDVTDGTIARYGFSSVDAFLTQAGAVKALLPPAVFASVTSWACSGSIAPPPWATDAYAHMTPFSSAPALAYHFLGFLRTFVNASVTSAKTREFSGLRNAQPLDVTTAAASAMVRDRLQQVAPPADGRWQTLMLAVESVMLVVDGGPTMRPITGIVDAATGRTVPMTKAALVRLVVSGGEIPPVFIEKTVGALVFGADLGAPHKMLHGGEDEMDYAVRQSGIVIESDGFVVPPAVAAPTIAAWALELRAQGATPDERAVENLLNVSMGEYFTLGWKREFVYEFEAAAAKAYLLSLSHIKDNLVLEVVDVSDGGVWLLHRGVQDPERSRSQDATDKAAWTDMRDRRAEHTDWYALDCVARAQTPQTRAAIARLAPQPGRLVSVGPRTLLGTDQVRRSRATEMAALVLTAMQAAVLKGIKEGAVRRV